MGCCHNSRPIHPVGTYELVYTYRDRHVVWVTIEDKGKHEVAQPKRNENRLAVISVVLLSGRIIDQKIVQCPAPSTTATSASSLGMLTINARMTIIAKGTAIVKSAKTTDKYELIRWR